MIPTWRRSDVTCSRAHHLSKVLGVSRGGDPRLTRCFRNAMIAQDVTGSSLDDVAQMLRGAQDSTVSLRLLETREVAPPLRPLLPNIPPLPPPSPNPRISHKAALARGTNPGISNIHTHAASCVESSPQFQPMPRAARAWRPRRESPTRLYSRLHQPALSLSLSLSLSIYLSAPPPSQRRSTEEQTCTRTGPGRSG